MSCIFKRLLNVVQYFSIIFGLTYIYIDNKNKFVKIYKSVKMYVHIFHFLFGGTFLCYFFNHYILRTNYTVQHVHTIISYISAYGIHVITFFALIILRFKEEKFIAKLHKIILKLQTIYFDKLSMEPVNETIKHAITLNMFIIMVRSLHSVSNIAVKVIKKELSWNILVSSCYINYFAVMELYIFFHHGLILCHINDYFTKLNDHLKYAPVLKIHANVYLHLSRILKEVNAINGSAVFYTIVSEVVSYSKYIFNIILYDSGKALNHQHYWAFFSCIICSSLIYLYFLICERVKNTTKETGIILMENRKKENQQTIENICFGRLVMELNVQVWGFFVIDLSALFAIVSAIINFTIVLIQSECYK
ncbi:uncharacterized protein ACRADG_010260 [Cochliomyia hominivorax]